MGRPSGGYICWDKVDDHVVTETLIESIYDRIIIVWERETNI